MRRKITNEAWEQIKTAYAAGIGLREIARKMEIPEGSVLAGQLSVMQSDAITPVQSVPQSLAVILSEHERETKLSLARSARRMAKDAEQATLRESSYVHKVAQTAGIVHQWDAREKNPNAILNVAILTGAEKPERVIDARECQDSGD